MALPISSVIVTKFYSRLSFNLKSLSVHLALTGTQSRRGIMTNLTRMEKVLEHLKTNPYFEKYAKNIARLQETSPEEFLSRIEEQEKKTKQFKEKREMERKFSEACNAKSMTNAPESATGAGKLSDIMKLELIADKGKEEIIEIWLNYHKLKSCISGAMTSAQFDQLYKRGKDYPTFLLPLPREHGYEFIVSQFNGTEIHMTPLIWYQTHKENAPECLTIHHYTELKDIKGIVLMRGEFDDKSMTVQEAQCLANELQLYYATANDDSPRTKLLKKFVEKPDEFKHMDLIAQLETITLTGVNETSSTVKDSSSGLKS